MSCDWYGEQHVAEGILGMDGSAKRALSPHEQPWSECKVLQVWNGCQLFQKRTGRCQIGISSADVG